MRRYDLDWLRVLVFMLLIFYHVGMFFVPWEWHIKNNQLYSWLEYPMFFVNQWRLPILFVISGMGTFYALAKRSGKQFAGERLKRLLLPLAVGIVLIVPPQVYFERLASGAFTGSYLEFWPWNAFDGIYPTGNFSWHHLWFLPYLLVFSLLLTPVFLYFRKHPEHFFLQWLEKQARTPFGFLWFLLPLLLPELLLKPYFPETHALWGDWYVLSYNLLLFFYGFILVSLGKSFWGTVENYRSSFLLVGITSFALLLLLRTGSLGILEGAAPVIDVVNTWTWVLTLFGYASRHLNRRSSVIKYANQAVYPFYILHQTITVGIGYYLATLEMSFSQKFFILAGGTFVISFLAYEFVVRRTSFLRPLFGLKPMAPKARAAVGLEKMAA